MDTTLPRRSDIWHYRHIMRWTFAIACIVLVLISTAFGLMMWHMGEVPADLDLATTRRSDQGRYQVSYIPSDTAVLVNQLHSWTIHIATAEGQTVNDAVITVDGGMPQHGHGLPTQPQATHNLSNGDYLVEGMKFHMSGWWVVDVTVDAHGQRDTVRFNLLLQ